ncbi:MAG: hypothetical protein HZC36_14445 [Armatimonadetes bacterium]|nr:hypothetical protein [Armatimonadota bacterium]
MRIGRLLKHWTLIGVVGAALALAGCGGGDDTPKPTPNNPNPEKPKTASAAQPGGQESVQVISPAAGAMSPVTGTDSVQGGGSGVGNVMKDRARGIAGDAPSSLNQGTSDEGGN